MTEKELLESTIEYYSTDVNRRCVADWSGCYYSPLRADKVGISDGCAIGRFMTEEQQRLAEGHPAVSLPYSQIPVSLRGIGRKFLGEIQLLHDQEDYWDEDGLTVSGKTAVVVLKKKYDI